MAIPLRAAAGFILLSAPGSNAVLTFLSDRLRMSRQAVAENLYRFALKETDLRGSRYRCLLVTGIQKRLFVHWLNSLIQPIAYVTEQDFYMPKGFLEPNEAKLGETVGFLSDEQRETVTSWWLAARKGANTPNWDICSTCTIGGHRGLVLVEAKAREGELKIDDQCQSTNETNQRSIRQAINDTNKGFGTGWALTPDRCFQLGNRFAWAWKVASLGVPVVLVYLGFLNANEMTAPFSAHSAWERCLLQYADGCVPRSVWTVDSITVNGTPLIPIIRSADVNVHT